MTSRDDAHALPTPEIDGLRLRPLDPSDLDAWWALEQRAQEVDRDPHPVTRSTLEGWLGRHGDDLAADTLVALDADGETRALVRVDVPAGQVDAVRALVGGVVDPTWRGRGVGRALLAWQLARAGVKVAQVRVDDGVPDDVPSEAGTFVRDGHPDAPALLARAGLERTRFFSSMSRDLSASPPSPTDVPGGLTEVDLGEADAVERTRVAHNDSFQDHWGYHPETPRTWASETTANEGFRPDLSRALLDADGVVAGYAVVSVRPEATGERVGHLELLGTTRAWRGRGLATFLLERTAGLVAGDGLARTTLGVDSASPTGADRLYVAHGYERVGGSTYWAVPLG